MMICMIISRYPPFIGGTERQCQRLAEALARRGHQVTIVTERLPNTMPYEVADGVTVYRLRTLGGLPWSSVIFFFCALAFIARHRGSIDVLHAHMLAAPAIV